METTWLASLVLDMPDAVVVADANGNLLWGNPAAESLFGVTNAEIAGKSAFELLHPEDHEIALASLESVQGKDVGTPIELRVRAREGWRLVELIGANLIGHSPVDGLLWCIRDLTERRRWEILSDETARFAPSCTTQRPSSSSSTPPAQWCRCRERSPARSAMTRVSWRAILSRTSSWRRTAPPCRPAWRRRWRSSPRARAPSP